MLDVQMLKAMPDKTIFAMGIAKDVPDGLFMANTGQDLMWCAVRGNGYHDWAIYCLPMPTLPEFIVTNGDKVTGENHIKMLVPCENDAFEMYRY